MTTPESTTTQTDPTGAQTDADATELDDAVDDSGDDDSDGTEPTWDELLAERDELRQRLEVAEDASKSSKEAAKYRTQLRETEQTLESAQKLIAGLRDHAANGELERAGLDRRLLDMVGAEVGDFLTDDGLVDGERLVAALKPLADEMGIAKPRRPAPVPTAGRTTASPAVPSGRDAWDRAFGVKR